MHRIFTPLLFLLFVLFCVGGSLEEIRAVKPNIVFILAGYFFLLTLFLSTVFKDDLGWADVGYHRTENDPEVVTPTIDSLVANGIQLDQHVKSSNLHHFIFFSVCLQILLSNSFSATNW